MNHDNAKKIVVKIRGLTTHLKEQQILKDVNLDIYRYEILGLVGESGCGKTTLMRNILMLQKPSSGSIKVFDTDLSHCTERQAIDVQRRWGVMFQQSALFSSLTVLENVLFPLHNLTDIQPSVQKEIAFLKIALAGLPISAANKYPSELSGGMQKRAALARAISLDPELLFLDEPTAGLDPKSAEELDQLVLDLRKALNLTIVMITHDIHSLWATPDRIAFVGEGKVLAVLPMNELVNEMQPAIRRYFSSLRVQQTGSTSLKNEESVN